MSYRNDVAEAKRLRKRSEDDQWRLAELTWDVVEDGTTRKQWATDVGFGQDHAGILYRIWDRWGGSTRVDRPPFWDCYRKVQSGDDTATNDRHRADTNLANATPAAIAKVVAGRPDYQRAIARNTAAREAIEEEGISVRANHPASKEERERWEKTARDVGHGVGKALGADEVVTYLRGAASDIGNAIMVSEQYGVEDTDGEAEALAKIKHLLRVYEQKADLTEADESFLDSLGIRT